MPETEPSEVHIGRGYHCEVYHLDEECHDLGDEYRTVSPDQVDPTYRACAVCDGSARNGGAVPRECPVCGERVEIQLGLHLTANCAEVAGDE